MDRRSFLKRLVIGAAATAAVAVADPEALLWTPTKRIFLPPPTGWVPMNTVTFHKDAFKFAMDGMSLRMVKGYDIATDQFPSRFDVLYGAGSIRPDLAIRLTDMANETPDDDLVDALSYAFALREARG